MWVVILRDFSKPFQQDVVKEDIATTQKEAYAIAREWKAAAERAGVRVTGNIAKNGYFFDRKSGMIQVQTYDFYVRGGCR